MTDWVHEADPLLRRLDMIPSESARSNAALRDYALMGPGRTLRDLRQKYVEQMGWWKEQIKQKAGEGQAEKPPTASIQTLFGWSIKYEWQERVARWDILQQQAEEAAYQADRVAARRLRLEAAKGAFNLTGQTLMLIQQNKLMPRKVIDLNGQEIEYPPAVVGETTLAQAVSTLERAMNMLRKEFGDETQQIDLTLRQIDYSEFTDDELQRIKDGESPLRILSESRHRRTRVEEATGEPSAGTNGL
jgi:hypothetical protein